MDVRDDLIVAGVAAGCTVGLALLLEFALGGAGGTLIRMAPIGVYFLYLFTRRTALSAVDATTWAGLTIVVTLGVLVAVGL